MMDRPMNRRERRRAEALARAREKPLNLPPARADGRPEYYMVEPNPPDLAEGTQGGATCYVCAKNGVHVRYHKFGEVVLSNPANPPAGARKGDGHTICIHHLPDDAVIYNPRTNLCHNKSGDSTWEEGKREEILDELRDV